jgi:2-phospho-L-lactate guanylyltransferase
MNFAVLPMKPPSIGKTRLSEEFDASFRQALAAAMFADVLVALTRSRSIDKILVVTEDFDCARMAMLHGAEPVDDPGLSGHSEAAAYGANHAIGLGCERLLLVPGDCPALEPAEVDALFAIESTSPACCVVPDRHGSGTNALLMTPPLSIEPGFGPGSRERHLERCAEAGVHGEEVELASLAHDVDTPDDLDELIAHLKSTRGNAASTRGLLLQLGKVSLDD